MCTTRLNTTANPSNGSVIVSRHTNSGGAEVCASPGAGIVSPIILTVVRMDGSGASAQIEFEAARLSMQ